MPYTVSDIRDESGVQLAINNLEDCYMSLQ